MITCLNINKYVGEPETPYCFAVWDFRPPPAWAEKSMFPILIFTTM